MRRFVLNMTLNTPCAGVVYAQNSGEASEAFAQWKATLLPGLNNVELRAVAEVGDEPVKGESVIAVVEDGEVTLL